MQTSFQLQHVILDELQCKRDIESYDNFMEQYPYYPKIWWYRLLGYRTGKEKCFCSDKLRPI